MRVHIKKLLIFVGVLQLSFALFLWYSATVNGGQIMVFGVRTGDTQLSKTVFNVTKPPVLTQPVTKILKQVTQVKYATESKCGNITIPLELCMDNTWHPVGDSRTIFVFSAYYTTRSLTIIGIEEVIRQRVGVIAQLWFYSEDEQSLTMNETSCQSKSVSEGHNKR